MQVFISYSHKDENMLERLHVHLASLRRDGEISTWFDREILGGDNIDGNISEAVERSDIFLFLVSPDFLNSDYCVEKELTRAIERHDSGDARVIPIIIEPCDWTSGVLRKLKALPKDGKPVSEWHNTNSAFLDIVREIRKIVSVEGGITDQQIDHSALNSFPDLSVPVSKRRAKSYRIQRKFDRIDGIEFRDKSFEAMSSYIRDAVEEINSVQDMRGKFFVYGESSFGCVIVNNASNGRSAHLTVHCGSNQDSLGDIYYSFSERSSRNTASGIFRVESDEYEQFLRASLFAVYEVEKEKLTAIKAAELIWTELLKQAGVEYE